MPRLPDTDNLSERMDEPVFAEHYVRIWMTSATYAEVVGRVAKELGLPITAGEVLLMAERIRRGGVGLPSRPAAAAPDPVRMVPHPDGDYRDTHGRTAYRVGPGTPVEGPWVCARCRGPMCGGFMLLAASLDAHWPVCGGCAAVTD